MHAPLPLVLLVALLPLQVLAEPLGIVQCRAWRERRNQLAAEAMRVEIALVAATRRQLCPQLEALAERANAGGDPRGATAAAEAAVQGDFDYSAYLECRRRAEERLRRSRTILYTNQRGFTFYTLSGARLARQADGWQQRLSASCASDAAG